MSKVKKEVEMKFSGDLLQIRRKLLDYSLREMGEMVGVSKVTVSNWETGRSYPGKVYLNKLYQILETKPEHMLLRDMKERAKNVK